MAFSTSRNANPKYRQPEHIRYAKQLKAQLAREGVLHCTAKRCLFDTRDITNPDGRAPDGLTAGHNDAGDGYDGAQHRRCNTSDGARRGNRARKEGSRTRWVL